MRRETQAGVLSAAELDLGSENRPRSETPGSVNGNKRGKTQGGLTFIGSLSRSMWGADNEPPEEFSGIKRKIGFSVRCRLSLSRHEVY